ncbi:MAG: TIGR02147 family protein [Bdellovibrionota bacterium]
MSGEIPTIQNYNDYREFLRDWFNAVKALNPKVSYRFLSRQIGLKSPNHLHMVMNKKRHLSQATLIKLQKVLGLNRKEKSYLLALLELNTAKNPTNLSEVETKLIELKEDMLKDDLPLEHLGILSNSLAWFIVIGAQKFNGLDLEEIYELVNISCPFNIPKDNIYRALNLLERLGKLEIKENKYMFDFSNIKTAWDFDRSEIKQFHYNNLRFALHSIPWEIERRFLSNVSIPANKKVLEYAKSEIRSLCKRILKYSEQEVIAKDDLNKVLSIEFAMFPFFEFSEK